MNAKTRLYGSIVVTALGLGAFLSGCGDESTGSGGSGGSGGDTASSSSSSSSSASSSGSGMVGPELKTINKTAFDAMKGQLPEGLAISADGKTAYVGYSLSGEIVKVSLPEGVVTAFGKVPTPAQGAGLVLGIALDKDENVYVGAAKLGAGSAYAAGVYKIPKAGGDGALFASDAALTFPNGLVFDKAGNLYVADSVAAAIIKIAPDKTVTKWLENDLLKGDQAGPCKAGLPVQLGANGLIMNDTEAYVANTEKASIIKVPITAGVAGTPVEFAKSDATCAPLKGIDGLAFDKAGNILTVSFSGNALYSVSKDGSKVTPLHSMGFESPASLAVVTLGGVEQVLITNSSIDNAFQMKPGKPALVSFGPLK